MNRTSLLTSANWFEANRKCWETFRNWTERKPLHGIEHGIEHRNSLFASGIAGRTNQNQTTCMRCTCICVYVHVCMCPYVYACVDVYLSPHHSMFVYIQVSAQWQMNAHTSHLVYMHLWCVKVVRKHVHLNTHTHTHAHVINQMYMSMQISCMSVFVYIHIHMPE